MKIKTPELYKIEFRIFLFFLKRFLIRVDQWERIKIKAGGCNWFIDISMQDDGYKYNEF